LIFKRNARSNRLKGNIGSLKKENTVTRHIKILGYRLLLPELVVENERFSEIVETSDEWISSRTGIKKRHFSQGEATWEMASRRPAMRSIWPVFPRIN
jgi:hypothetical protein